MSNITYFFDETFLIENTTIDDNVDPKYLRMAMRVAQEVKIQSILGSSLYKDLMTEFENDPTLNLLPNYKTLVDDYIQQAFLWCTLVELPSLLNFKLTNIAVVKKDGDNSTSVDRDDLTYIINKSATNAEWYLTRLKEYICANETLFPAYNSGTELDEIHPDNKSNSSAMYLRRGKSWPNMPTFQEPYGTKNR